MDVEEDSLVLPPGFRFHPTDEEIVTYYLTPKILSRSFIARAMDEVDLNKCEPWDLPSKAKMTGEKEWYFFCQRDKKYPTGTRTNRATESGYWKATGKDKEIYRGRGVLVGMKKTLVFYRGRAPKGEKTNWVMHEFRLEGKLSLPNPSAKEEWGVCRVFDKNTGSKKLPMHGVNYSFTDNELLTDSPTLPPLMDTAFINSGDGDGDGAYNFEFKPQPMMPSYFFNDPSSSSSYLHHQIDQAHDQNPYLSDFGDMGDYLNHEPQVMTSPPAIRRHCKVEQFSNQSMISQDTAISTDRNTEISSTAIAGDVLDLQSMWRC